MVIVAGKRLKVALLYTFLSLIMLYIIYIEDYEVSCFILVSNREVTISIPTYRLTLSIEFSD
jgi:hypothetical protein